MDELDRSDLFTLTLLQLPKLSKITTLISGVNNGTNINFHLY